MFFWSKRKSSKTNVIELERVILNKSESIYFLYNESNKKDLYGIHTVVRNVPLVLGDDGKLIAKVRYVGIPNVVVYFVLRVSNIQGDYISRNSTVDVSINAVIKNGKCKEAKFQLLPTFERGGVLACM